MFQIGLFEKAYADQYIENGYSYAVPQVNDVTFLNGLSEPVHRWFRLTPSYSPELVRFLVKYLDCSKNTLICDPFLGKGTTAIELKRLGLPIVGVELNPLLKMVSDYALTWEVDRGDFAGYCLSVEKEISELIESHKNDSLEEVLDRQALSVPVIHNVFRWWRKPILKDLLLAKKVVLRVQNEEYKKLLWIALCSSSLDCANIHRNHPTITFDDDHARKINVSADFKENVDHILKDLERLPSKNWGKAKVLLGDSTKLASVVHNKIDRVITSPPYPNRFSYIHQTRPQLFFMEVFENAAQSADVDLAAIGGTWGKATSIIYDGIVEPYPHLAEILDSVIEELRPKSNLMCNYAVKYFNMLDSHIQQLLKIVNPGFRGAYVVGNSRLSGVEIVTEVVSAKIFEAHGFNVDNLLVFRKRGGRRSLYETAVCISLP
ncbi:MAG: hypothetical protein V7641_3917 [Blastocatellia bacterium]